MEYGGYCPSYISIQGWRVASNYSLYSFCLIGVALPHTNTGGAVGHCHKHFDKEKVWRWWVTKRSYGVTLPQEEGKATKNIFKEVFRGQNVTEMTPMETKKNVTFSHMCLVD